MHYLNFHEGKQHGTADFPAAYYYVDRDHPQYNMPFHWHKEWEIIRVLQGELVLHVDEQEYCAGSGDLLLIRDGMLHGGTPVDCVYECFVFDLHGLFRDVSAVKKYLRPIYHNHLLPQVFYPDRQRDIYPFADEIMSTYAHREHNPCAPQSGISFQNCRELTVLGNLSLLFASILQKEYYILSTQNTPDSSRKITQVKPVLEYIENHFSVPITLGELAGVAGMSSKYFCRFFHSITQQTPMDYVNYYRIEQAASMLVSTDLSVTAISLECGFNDSSYFVKAFKKYKGMTPKQYRKANF